MRKLSAHFCLLPDGTLGKWPVISIDSEGRIKSVRVNDEYFREEPGLEYYGGVLVPGFIEDFRDVSFANAGDIKLLNRFYSQGSIKFLCRQDQNFFPQGFGGEVFRDETFEQQKLQECSRKSFWEKAKGDALAGYEGNIIKSIFNLQEKIIKSLPEELKWGRIKEGFSPGLLLIKGLNLDDMSVTEKSTIKILHN